MIGTDQTLIILLLTLILMCFFLLLLFKNQNKTQPETAAALKRTLEALMDRGAVVRSLENLGERTLPYKMSAHS